MRKLIVLLAAFGLVAAGCGGGSESCGDIADDAVALFQDVVDEMDALTLEELTSDEVPAVFEDIETKAEEIDDRADEANCSLDELGQMVADRADSITTESELGRAFVDQLESGVFFE